MIKKVNNKGLSLSELVLAIVISGFVIAVITGIVMEIAEQEKFKTFKSSASNLGKVYLFPEDLFYDDRVYLGELIEMGLISSINNPFYIKDYNDVYCDNYESFVDYNGDLYVTLLCGDYLIRNALGGQHIDEYTVYEVSSWDDEVLELDEGEELETVVMYNYLYDNVEVNYRYYDERTFIRLFNIATNKSFTNIDDVKNNANVIEKTFYRTIKKADL